MNTLTAPPQWMVDAVKMLIGILAIIFLVTVYCAGKVLAFNPVVTLTAIVLIYFVWLWFTTRRVVAEEFGEQVTISHAVAALIPAQLTTWLLFIVFFFATQTGWHWLIAQIPD